MKNSLKRECLHLLRETFGLEDYRPGQKAAVDALLSGRDLMCILPTGSGKSLCWQLPALVHTGLTVVVSPLIALMHDQVQHLRMAGIAAASLDSLMTPEERSRTMETIRKGDVRILFVSPERLEQHQFCQLCREVCPWLVVVDEAHCIVQWGEEFRPSYLMIGEFLKALPAQPVLCALTATADRRMQRSITRQLGMRREKRVVLPHIRENLIYEVRTTLDTAGEILRICRQDPCKTVVFCGTRQGTEWLADLLRRNGMRADHYHAGMDRQQRLTVQEDFRAGKCDILCATSAFGMGVDIPDIQRIIHDHLPNDLIDYAQQSGRAGRDGQRSACILLFEPNDFLLRARIPRRVASDLGRHPIRRLRYEIKYWRGIERLMHALLASPCIPSAMASALGRGIKPCGKCSACLRGQRITRIPHFRRMKEWEIRLWFLSWQREELARRRHYLPQHILPDMDLMTGARKLVFPPGCDAQDELKRLLAHFRGERAYNNDAAGR